MVASAGRPIGPQGRCRWSTTRRAHSTSREKATGSIWLSPHDEIDTDPCDAAPEESTSRSRSIASKGRSTGPWSESNAAGPALDRSRPIGCPVYGFDPRARGFFWCAGQGGFGIQTAPAAATLAASELLDEAPDAMVAHVDPAIFSPSRFG
jgi:D-arginine dehydrogenase